MGVIRLRNFGGLDTETAPDFMDPRDSPDCLNVHTLSGVIRARPGLQREYTYEIPSSNAAPYGVERAWIGENHADYPVNQALYVVRAGQTLTGSKICRYANLTPGDGTISSECGDAGAWKYFRNPGVAFQDLSVFPEDENNALWKMDSSGALAALAVSPASCQAAAVEKYNNMLFSWSTYTAGATLAYSNINNCELWTSSNTLTVGADQTYGRFLRSVGDWMVAGKSSGIYAVRGFGSASLRVDCLSRELGTQAEGHVAGNQEGVFFLGSPPVSLKLQNNFNPWTGVYVVSSEGRITNISKKLTSSSFFDAPTHYYSTSEMFDLHSCCLYWDPFNEALYVVPFRAAFGGVANPVDTESEGRTIWVWNAGNWAKWNLIHDDANSRSFHVAHLCQGIGPGKVLMVGPGFTGYRYVYGFYDTRAMDTNGTYTCSSTTYPELARYWTTPYLMYSASEQNDETQCVYLYGKASGTGAGVEVHFRADGDTAWTRIDPSGGNTYWPLQEQGVRIDVHVYCRRIQFKLVFTDASYSAEIQGLDVCYKPLARES